MKKLFRIGLLFEVVLLVCILIFSIRPVENYDFWFHVKYGEYILQTRNLPFTEVFSHTVYGSQTIPYEWFFQLGIAIVYNTFGDFGVQSTVIILLLIYLLLFRQILKEIFGVPLVPRMIFIAALPVFCYDFWVERPQIVAYTLFIAVFYIVLKRVFVGKNWLWMSIPLFFIWTNTHASMILGLYLFFSFGGVLFLKYIKNKNHSDLLAAKDLVLFGSINTVITLLPPLGIKVYQLLIVFFEKRDFIQKVLTEWVPLSKVATPFSIYIVLFIFCSISFLLAIKKAKSRMHFILFLPFIPLVLFLISGIRHAPFILPVMFLFFVPVITIFKIKTHSVILLLMGVVIIGITSWSLQTFRKETTGIAKTFPSGALSFIKNNIEGNMFNEYYIGGYLLYHLGPEYKTFADGRTEMFLDTVLPEYIAFSSLSYTDDTVYFDHFMNLVKKYNISWTILTTKEHFGFSARLSRILDNARSWRLVYFDDTARIYVFKSEANKETWDHFGMVAATPFSKRLYRDGMREIAKSEYKAMYSRQKSAVAANALGVLLLEDKKYEEATQRFQDAVSINPYAASPKMNLAELAVKNGDFNRAIELYRKAIQDDPERGLAYLRLGQIIIDSGGSEREAIEIWKKGLKATPDEQILSKLQEALDLNL